MAVLLICCIGAYSLNRSYFDVIIMFIAGILGFSSASSTTRWGPGAGAASGRHVRDESETYSDAVGRESDAPFHNTDLHASGRTDSAGNRLARNQ